jgi:hypothetical protein
MENRELGMQNSKPANVLLLHFPVPRFQFLVLGYPFLPALARTARKASHGTDIVTNGHD